MPRGEKGRKPDYRLSAKNMETGVKGTCGAAWVNDDGSINIVLDPWVVLRGGGYLSDKVNLALYRQDGYRADKPAPESEPKPIDIDPADDDIPF